MKDRHPIAAMSAPTFEEVRRGAVAGTWMLRETLGEVERLLDSPAGVTDETLESLSALGGMALGLSMNLISHANDPEAADDAAQLLKITRHHCSAAAEHLRNHFSYARLLLRNQGTQVNRLTELGEKEREYAARTTQIGRQATHRALAKMVEAWPDSFSRDEEP
jgi:hypothetical protein